MFDKLIEVLQSFGTKALPFTVVNEYELAILLRFGIYKRDAYAGLVWKYPFIDNIMRVDARQNYSTTHPRTFITRDRKTVTVSAIASFKGINARQAVLSQVKYGNSIWDGLETGMSKLIQTNDYETIVSDVFADMLFKYVKAYNLEYGIDVKSCRLKDTSNATAFRLFKED